MNKKQFFELMLGVQFWALIRFIEPFVDKEFTVEECLEKIWNVYILDSKEIMWHNSLTKLVSPYAENMSEQIDHVFFFDWVREYSERYKYFPSIAAEAPLANE